MGVVARRSPGRTPAPAGLHHAVCVDVQDLGLVSSSWGPKHRVRIVWQIADVDAATGKRFELARVYTLSLALRAPLRSSLESWRSKPFTEDELKDGFDLERLIGVNCQLQAMHDTGTDGVTVYCNVNAVLPPPKGVRKLAPDAFTRLKDRATPGGRR